MGSGVPVAASSAWQERCLCVFVCVCTPLPQHRRLRGAQCYSKCFLEGIGAWTINKMCVCVCVCMRVWKCGHNTAHVTCDPLRAVSGIVYQHKQIPKRRIATGDEHVSSDNQCMISVRLVTYLNAIAYKLPHHGIRLTSQRANPPTNYQASCQQASQLASRPVSS